MKYLRRSTRRKVFLVEAPLITVLLVDSGLVAAEYDREAKEKFSTSHCLASVLAASARVFAPFTNSAVGNPRPGDPRAHAMARQGGHARRAEDDTA